MVDLNRKIKATQAQQGGFSAQVLPADVSYAPIVPGTVLVYSDGSTEPVITGGPLKTGAGVIASVGSGGPFGEPYFQTLGVPFNFSGSPLALGTGNYTVDAWYRRTSTASIIYPVVVNWVGQATSGAYSENRVYVNVSENFPGQPVPAPNINVFAGRSATTDPASEYLIQKGITLDVWRHIAVQRRNNLLEAWDNGSKITSVWLNDNYTEPLDFGANTTFAIGSGTYTIDVGQIRINPGTAIYPSGAAITVPTAPFFVP